MIVLDATIVNVALPSIRDGPRLHRDVARVGRQRVPADLRRLAAARRPARRPATGTAGCSSIGITLFTLASLGVRPVDVAGDARRRARRAGRRRRGRVGGVALADHGPLHRAGRAREGDGALRLRRRPAAAASASCSAACSRTRSTGTGSSSSTSRSASRSCVLCAAAPPAPQGPRATGRLDVAGAVTVTAALMVAVYAIVNGNAERLDVGADARAARRRGGALRDLRVDRVARLARRSCRSASSGSQPRDGERRRRPLGRPRCSRGSSSRRSTCSSCSATARSRSACRSCRRT